MDTTTPAQAFLEAKRQADEAKATLIARLDAIKAEKKETLARLNSEAKEIRALIGRARKMKAQKGTTTRTRKQKPAAADEVVPA